MSKDKDEHPTGTEDTQPGQRIGVAKGRFEVPDTIDAPNDEVASGFVGDAPRKKYRLADLLAEMPEGMPLDDPEIEEWMDMKPIGREILDPTDDCETRRSVPGGEVYRLLRNNPWITVADLIALCDSHGIDLVLIPRDSANPVALLADQGELRTVEKSISDYIMDRCFPPRGNSSL